GGLAELDNRRNTGRRFPACLRLRQGRPAKGNLRVVACLIVAREAPAPAACFRACLRLRRSPSVSQSRAATPECELPTKGGRRPEMPPLDPNEPRYDESNWRESSPQPPTFASQRVAASPQGCDPR